MKSHYRSAAATSISTVTGANSNLANVTLHNADFNSAAFWTPAGGAIAIDEGIPVPQFQDDIILRGGRVTINLCNPSGGSDDIRFKLYLFRTEEAIPDWTDGFQPREWDPTMYPDFQRRLGHVVMSREFVLKDAESMNVSFRLSVRKIDQGRYLEGDRRLYWMVVASANVSTSQTYTVITSYNMSFSGDVVDEVV